MATIVAEAAEVVDGTEAKQVSSVRPRKYRYREQQALPEEAAVKAQGKAVAVEVHNNNNVVAADSSRVAHVPLVGAEQQRGPLLADAAVVVGGVVAAVHERVLPVAVRGLPVAPALLVPVVVVVVVAAVLLPIDCANNEAQLREQAEEMLPEPRFAQLVPFRQRNEKEPRPWRALIVVYDR